MKWKWFTAVSTAVFELLAVASSQAQLYGTKPDRQGWYLTPSLAAGGLYEDNVFFVPGPLVGSPFARITPGLDAQYRRNSRSFTASYSFDSELYPSRYNKLSKLFARQEGFGEFHTALDRRSTLSVGASYLSTTRPEEVLQEAGLLSARSRSRSLVATARFNRKLSRRLTAEVGYALSVRKFERPARPIPMTGETLHAIVAALSFRHSRLVTGKLGYTTRLLVPDEIPLASVPTLDFNSHVVTYEVSGRLTRRLEFSLTLGPRISEGLRPPASETVLTKVRDFGPEADASLRLRGNRTNFEFRYTKTQQQAFGLGGFTNTQRYTFGATFDPSVRVRLEANPALFRNETAGIDTTSVIVDIRAIYQFRRTAMLEAAYRFQYQDRFGYFLEDRPGFTDQGTRRNTVMVSIKLFKTYDAN